MSHAQGRQAKDYGLSHLSASIQGPHHAGRQVDAPYHAAVAQGCLREQRIVSRVLAGSQACPVRPDLHRDQAPQAEVGLGPPMFLSFISCSAHWERPIVQSLEADREKLSGAASKGQALCEACHSRG